MSESSDKNFKSPFRRPWLEDSAPAAPAGKGKLGLRGILAGGVTGGIEICITYPTEFVKTQLQLDEKGEKRKYKGIIDCVKVTVREKGFFGLYKGLSILIVGSIPKSAVRFGAYETFKDLIRGADGRFSPGQGLLCGLGAGASEAIFAVTPMETIKVKFINDQRSAHPKFKGLFHGLGVIVKEQGVSGMYKGVVATIIKQSTNQATRFFVMESCKKWYRGVDTEKSIPKPIIGLFGGFAGFCSVYVNTPVDVVKTRMQGLEASRYRNTLHCFISVGKNEGFFAYYKGTVPRLGRVVLDVGITFTIYESIMDLFNYLWPKS